MLHIDMDRTLENRKQSILDIILKFRKGGYSDEDMVKAGIPREVFECVFLKDAQEKYDSYIANDVNNSEKQVIDGRLLFRNAERMLG